MSLRKDPTIYTATFSGLTITAFGRPQVLNGLYTVTVFQASCNPQRWKCRPTFAKGNLVWEADTAEALCGMIAANFQECVSEWEILPAPAPAARSLTNGAQEAMARRRNKLGA